MSKLHIRVGVIAASGERHQMVHRPCVTSYSLPAEMTDPLVALSKSRKKDDLGTWCTFLSRSTQLVVRLDPRLVFQVVAFGASSFIRSHSFNVVVPVALRCFSPYLALPFWGHGDGF